MKIKLKQASAFVWFVFILAILVFGFAYLIISKPVQVTYNQFYNDTVLDDQVYQDFYIRAKTIWYWFPLSAAIAMFLWAMIKLNQRDEYGGV